MQTLWDAARLQFSNLLKKKPTVWQSVFQIQGKNWTKCKKQGFWNLDSVNIIFYLCESVSDKASLFREHHHMALGQVSETGHMLVWLTLELTRKAFYPIVKIVYIRVEKEEPNTFNVKKTLYFKFIVFSGNW